jgi:hypothetical protein
LYERIRRSNLKNISALSGVTKDKNLNSIENYLCIDRRTLSFDADLYLNQAPSELNQLKEESKESDSSNIFSLNQPEYRNLSNSQGLLLMSHD